MEAPKTYTRPEFSAEEALELLQSFWGVRAAKVKSLPSYDDQNFAVLLQEDAKEPSYVLKLFHKEEKESTLELQTLVMNRLAEVGVCAPRHVPLVDESAFKRIRGHLGRLLKWVPGNDWCSLDLQDKMSLMFAVGELNGHVDAALRETRSEGGAEHREWVWRTSNVGLLQHYRWAVEKRQSAGRLACFDRLLAEIRAEEEKALKSVSSGLVHNDLNDHNTIVGRDDDSTPKIRGLIDLGDLCVERHCFSLGNTLFYMMLTLPLERVLEAARSVVQGYISRNPLSPEELRLAWFGAKLRCLTSATMSGVTQEKYPEDPYVGETEKPGWNLLDYILDIPHFLNDE